ncbi:MAG: hypothetical protein A3C36_07050 [Omnitrophica WOR_2 bacterium RIFCSPHIGHO2_02_FULL_52_10]|nr:MAG: hypothetical protein A3C36_07050 [Omnitrophica WOR_2 bacterium RIFCSPHIGHO2_02_FULL_52_10]
MKFRIILTITILLLSASDAVFAELSLTGTWRIEQAAGECQASGNQLLYPEYWQDAVTEENKETLCMAERFSDLVALDGDTWLKTKAAPMIQQCREDAKVDKRAYFTCLQENLESVTGELGSPCRELGVEKLWDEKMCRRLISYIFISKFEQVLEASQPLKDRILARIERVKDIAFARNFFNPVIAVIFLVLYVLDVVVVDSGNWTRVSQRVSRMGFTAGPAILGSCFAQGGLRHFISGCIIAVLVIAVIVNHIRLHYKLKKERGYIGR